MKKVLSLFLVIIMVLGLFQSVQATENAVDAITVYLSISENGEFVTSPVTSEKMANIPVEISYFDLANYGLEAYYRYEADTFENGGGYINTTVVEQPTLMHLFIKSVEDYYIADTYNSEAHNNILNFTGTATSAYAGRFWEHDSNLTYLINDKMPEMCAGWGASCDYILLEDGMNIEICMFSTYDWATSGTVASFSDKEIQSYSGGTIDFSVKGDPIFYGGNEKIALGSDKIFLVKSSQLDWVNDDSAEYFFEADENGVFNVRFDNTGIFYVSAIDVNVGMESSTIAPAVCKVTVTEPEPLPEYTGEWTSFRGNESNMAVGDWATPQIKNQVKLKWAQPFTDSWMDATTPPIIVNGDIYFAKNDKIICVSKDDGSVISESEQLAGNIGFGTTSITYGSGMFYVPLGSGRIQAIRADTLESVWISEALGGQTINPITYKNGKIYCGTYVEETADGTYFCLSVEDDDTNKKTEEKECLWKIVHSGGFYWAGAYATDNYVIFGSDDGLTEGESGTSVLYSVNPDSGDIIDTIDGLVGDIRSTVAYDSITDRIYFTTKGGTFCKVKVNCDGTFDDETFAQLELGGPSTVTPLVLDGLAYIGVSENGENKYKIIDAAVTPMKIVAECTVPGYVQASALLTSAYHEGKGLMYVYITYNNPPGGIYVLTCRKINQKDSDGADMVEFAANDLYTPTGDMAQYCICSPICDSDGTIYYKNDSGYLMAIERYVRNSSVVVGGETNNNKEPNKDNNTNTNINNNKADISDKTKEDSAIVEKAEQPSKPMISIVFNDIENHWAKDYINKLMESNIIKGKAEGVFAPDDNITRAEFIELLYRLSGNVLTNAVEFDDVNVDDWYYSSIAWAVEKGIATGVDDRRFSPDENITREQAVTFIARYLDFRRISVVEANTGVEFADDETISQWAKQAVRTVKNTGIVSGKENNLFAPADNATRAETAKIIVKLIDVIEKYEK